MNSIQGISILITAIIVSSYTLYKNVEWSIAEGYSISFSSDNPSGVFTSFTRTIKLDPDNLSTADFDLVIDVNSINTGNGMKNNHALSDEWFDAKQYPQITFKSHTFEKDEATFYVLGIMTIHGISKEMKIPFDFTNNTFISTFKINRTDYNVGSTEGMSAMASRELTIDVKVPVKAKQN